eukprot:843794-Rhodomonas_salina.1
MSAGSTGTCGSISDRTALNALTGCKADGAWFGSCQAPVAHGFEADREGLLDRDIFLDARQRHAFVEQKGTAESTFGGFVGGAVNAMFRGDSPGRQQGLACSGCGLFTVDSCLVCPNCSLVATDMCMNIESELRNLAEQAGIPDWADALAAGQGACSTFPGSRGANPAPLTLALHAAARAPASKKAGGCGCEKENSKEEASHSRQAPWHRWAARA